MIRDLRTALKNIVLQGDEPYPVGGETATEVFFYPDVIPAEAGEVRHDDAVDPACFDVGDHLPERRTVKAGAGVAVIDVGVGQHRAFLSGEEGVQQLLLAADAVALRPVAVLLREPGVQSDTQGSLTG